MKTKTTADIIIEYSKDSTLLLSTDKWVKVDDMIKEIRKHTDCEHYHKFNKPDGKNYYLISCLQSILNKLSQSNPDVEILSDTKNTNVEFKSLTKDRSIQPMINRPDVDKALGNDIIELSSNSECEKPKVSHTLKCECCNPVRSVKHKKICLRCGNDLSED